MQALARANEVRKARSDFRQALGACTAPEAVNAIQTLLANGFPWFLESMEVMELLRCVDRVGRARAVRLLAALPLPENKPLAALTIRQRQALSEAVVALRSRNG
jgi:hypothetical protein